MAENNSILSMLLSIAAGVGIGAAAARRAARLAQHAKEAAEAAQFASTQQSVRNLTEGRQEASGATRAHAGGHVIADMPPGTENARTLTQMLAGGNFSERAQQVAAPIPPPIAGQESKRPTFRHAAKRIFGELLGLPGSRVNPYTLDASEDEEYQRMQRQTPPPAPKVPGFKGLAHRVSSHAGGWLQAKGAKMGGRLGGAMQEAGSFIGGAATGAGAGMAAGGPPGAAIGAAVGFATQAASAAASGDQGADAHQQSGTGKAIDTLGALSVTVFGVTKGFQFLSTSLMESSRDLRRFSGVINTGFARQEQQQIVLAARTARGTSGTASTLSESVMEMREAMQPLDQSMQNMKNLLGAGMAKLAANGAKLLTPMVRTMDLAVQFFNWILDNKDAVDENPALPFERAMRTMAGWEGERRPTSKRPNDR